jgi:RNA polymerase sigma factor (sigma-70 family)
MSPSKLELQHAIQRGDNDLVLGYLYKTALPKVRTYIVNNSGTREEADDIFQDAVMILYKKMKDGQAAEIENVDGFVYLICKNLWVNRVSKLNKNIKIDNHIDYIDQSIGILDGIISVEKNIAFEKLFEQVGEKCKQLLVLAIYNKMSMEEIAQKMDFTSSNAAKTHHYRCKQKLAELVEKDEVLKSMLK